MDNTEVIVVGREVMAETITNFFQLNQQQQAIIPKFFRYLRYYPHDLWLLFNFVISHIFLRFLRKENSNKNYIEHIYKYFIKTTYSEADINFYLQQLENGEVTRFALLASFLMIPASLEQKLFHTQGTSSHHEARLELVQKQLPAAQCILDIGGASGREPSGSLLMMGYPHQPKRIDIVDLPGNERFFQSSSEDIKTYTTPQGTQIDYHYISMTGITKFPDATFDLVWSGQSIEHITPEEASIVISQVYRILKPNGYFCLDTPNRHMTLLQVKQGFVHPEHKIEYSPKELINKLTEIGFNVVQQKAVSPMPISYQRGRFNRLELIHSKSLGDEPKNGYSFYLECQKS
ncbi:MAG: methyltransferase domain-containing protein [Cyanobacteria bacterium P01_D01_bin.116]